MRPLFLSSILSLFCLQAIAQKDIPTTTEFVVEGQVKKALQVNLDSIKAWPTETIDSLVIKNHLGQQKSVLKDIQGIPLKSILDKVEILSESPKQLSEFYFVFVAADGYKVVFSWNEVYNHPSGEGIYLIAGKNGKGIEALEDKISMFSQTDIMTGRRYVKGLKRIVVMRAE